MKLDDMDLARERNRVKSDWKFHTMLMSPDDYRDLQALAKKRGTSVNDLIRTYIAWGMESHNRQ